MSIVDQDLDIDLSIQYKTIVITKDRVIAGSIKQVNVVRETCFVFCKMLNSVKAFLIGKQRACIQVESEKLSIRLDKNTEDEDIEQQKQAELYDAIL